MRATRWLILFLALLATPAWAQQSVSIAGRTIRGTISANGGAVTLVMQPGETIGSAALQTLDTYSGTIEVRCSLDGVAFDADNEPLVQLIGSTTTASSITDTVGLWAINGVAACRGIRVIATAGFAASNVTLVISATSSGGGSSIGGGGAGTSDTTETTQLAVLAAVDGLETTTAAIQTATELTATHLDTLLESLAVDAEHDSDITASTGPPVMLEAKDFDGTALPNVVSAEGDAVRQAASLYGIAYTMLTNEDGSKELGKREDDAHTTLDYGVPVWAVRADTAAASGANGDDVAPISDALGLLWTRSLDPCSGTAKTYLAIDITTATTTELTAALAGASNHYYICAINIVTTAANSVALVDDDTDNCASVTSGLNGGLTAAEGWAFGANGGLTLGNGQGSVMRTNGTNRVLCMVTSAATELHGTVVIATAP